MNEGKHRYRKKSLRLRLELRSYSALWEGKRLNYARARCFRLGSELRVKAYFRVQVFVKRVREKEDSAHERKATQTRAFCAWRPSGLSALGYTAPHSPGLRVEARASGVLALQPPGRGRLLTPAPTD